MFVPQKNKLNKFQLVRIPRKMEHFARFGYQSAPAQAYSGDDAGVELKNKIDVIAEMDSYDKYMQRIEAENYQK